MLKHFLESKLIPAWHKLYSRLNTEKTKKVLSVLTIFIVSATVIWGVWRNTQPQEPVTLKDAASVYAQSVNALNEQSNLYYRVDGTITFTVGSNTIEEGFTQLITLESRDTAQLKICVEELCHIGTFYIKRFDFYSEGKEYLSVQGANFIADVTQGDFSEKFIPYALMDPALYTNISGISTKQSSTITFTNPVAVEQWCNGNTTVIDAQGTVNLDSANALISSEYTVTYKLGDMHVTAEYTATVIDTEFQPIELPDETNYTPISAIDSPYILEKTCGYLTPMSNIRTAYTDTITCQAFGDIRTQAFQLEISDVDGWVAQVDTTVSVSNSSKAGTTNSAKAERFSDNTYTVSIDGGEFKENPEVDWKVMDSYCQNLLIGTIMMPKDIAAVEISESDSHYTFSFRGTQEFAQVLAEEACTTLYQSATILTDMAETSVTNEISGYLTIDKNTGFPINSGFHYQGTYTISDLPYLLSFKADQSYTLPQ